MTRESYWKILLFLFLLVSVLALSFAVYYIAGVVEAPDKPSDIGSSGIPAGQEAVLATRVIDGDTIEVSGGKIVRLLGIDADEKGDRCYRAAKTRLEELVLGKTVSLEASESDTDRYGRSLRYVFAESRNTSLVLLSEGLAEAYLFDDNKKYREEVKLAESQAKTAKRDCKWEEKTQINRPDEEPVKHQ
jgi:endonuclease YncB( thermonuclease family)